MELSEMAFMISFGLSLCFSFVTSAYLLTSKRPAWSSNPLPRQSLRRNAGILALVSTLSHLWNWLFSVFISSVVVLNVIVTFIDMLFILPVALHFLIDLLNNGFKVKKWMTQWHTVILVDIPIVICALMYYVTRDYTWFQLCVVLIIVMVLFFSIYYFQKVHQYSTWLHESYADLEHKEVWWGFTVLAILIAFFAAYLGYDYSVRAAYIVRVIVIILIAFVTWRADDMQDLRRREPTLDALGEDNGKTSSSIDFAEQLAVLTIEEKFYLKNDITLQQLALKLGTNRTYLGRFFNAHGTSFNNYVNKLRVEHFIKLFHDSGNNPATISIKYLALQSGFGSYTTFREAFKRVMGCTPSEWVQENS